MLKKLVSGLLLAILLALPAKGAMAAEKRILVYGDSLSAGFGIAVSESWPALLGQRLKDQGSAFVVANASISGETTAGGRARFAAALSQFKPTVVILALGANDGLRGLPVSAMKDNLQAMARQAKQQGARVLLVGMRLPPNYGPQYTRDFDAAYRHIAKAGEDSPCCPSCWNPSRSNAMPSRPTACIRPLPRSPKSSTTSGPR